MALIKIKNFWIALMGSLLITYIYQGCTSSFDAAKTQNTEQQLLSGDGQGFEGKVIVSFFLTKGQYYWVDSNSQCDLSNGEKSHIKGIIDVKEEKVTDKNPHGVAIKYYKGCEKKDQNVKDILMEDIVVSASRTVIGYRGEMANFQKRDEPPHNEPKTLNLLGVCYYVNLDIPEVSSNNTLVAALGLEIRENAITSSYEALMSYALLDLSYLDKEDPGKGWEEKTLGPLTLEDETSSKGENYFSQNNVIDLILAPITQTNSSLRLGHLSFKENSLNNTYEFDFDDVFEDLDANSCIF